MTEPSSQAPLDVQLLVEPHRIRVSDLDGFRIGLTATNTSDEAIDPHLFAARLLVNGEFSPAFDLAIGNGVMPAAWDHLPAGDSTRPVYWNLGRALFTEPGEYSLVLRLDVDDWGLLESPATVLVTAD